MKAVFLLILLVGLFYDCAADNVDEFRDYAGEAIASGAEDAWRYTEEYREAVDDAVNEYLCGNSCQSVNHEFNVALIEAWENGKDAHRAIAKEAMNVLQKTGTFIEQTGQQVASGFQEVLDWFG